MNIIKREFSANLKSFIIWVVSLSVLFFAASTEYSVFAENEAVADALNNPTFQVFFKALGVNNIDILTPEGYLSLVSFYIYLPLSIYGAMIGSTIVSKEERDKTAEYLFTLPVTRKKVVISKLIVSITYSFLLSLWVMVFCYWAFGRIAGSDQLGPFVFNLIFGVFLTQLIFLAIGLFLSSILKQYKLSSAITLGILISTFMISMLTQITDKVSFMKYVTPFQYFNVNDMLNGIFAIKFIIITLFIVIGSISGLFYFYNKRDLYI